MPRYGRVVLGGTFDRLHVGHEALLATAFRAGRSVAIGLTTEQYLSRHPKPVGRRIQPYPSRRRALRRWLSARYRGTRWTVVPLDDGFGGSVREGVDALVVSADTVAGGRAVNAERRRRGLPAVPVLVVPLVLADDLRPLSSRRVRAGEVDRFGRRRSVIEVGLAVDAVEDRASATRGIRRAFPRAHVVVARFPLRSTHRTDRLGAAARSAAQRGELGVAVARTPGGRREVVVRSSEVALEPHVLPRLAPAAFSTALARLLERSARAKAFSPGRK